MQAKMTAGGLIKVELGEQEEDTRYYDGEQEKGFLERFKDNVKYLAKKISKNLVIAGSFIYKKLVWSFQKIVDFFIQTSPKIKKYYKIGASVLKQLGFFDLIKSFFPDWLLTIWKLVKMLIIQSSKNYF